MSKSMYTDSSSILSPPHGCVNLGDIHDTALWLDSFWLSLN